MFFARISLLPSVRSQAGFVNLKHDPCRTFSAGGLALNGAAIGVRAIIIAKRGDFVAALTPFSGVEQTRS